MRTPGQKDRQTDRRTDRRTDMRTSGPKNKQTDRHTYTVIPEEETKLFLYIFTEYATTTTRKREECMTHDTRVGGTIKLG